MFGVFCQDLYMRPDMGSHNIPRMKTAEERGALGAWLRGERTRRSWSTEEVSHQLAALGQPVSVSVIRKIEAGVERRPSLRVRAALARLFGSVPPTEEGSVDLADALAHLADVQAQQTQVLTELVERVEALADVQQGQTEALSTLIQDLPVVLAAALAPARGRNAGGQQLPPGPERDRPPDR